MAFNQQPQAYNLIKDSADILFASEQLVISNFRHRYTSDCDSAA